MNIITTSTVKRRKKNEKPKGEERGGKTRYTRYTIVGETHYDPN